MKRLLFITMCIGLSVTANADFRGINVGICELTGKDGVTNIIKTIMPFEVQEDKVSAFLTSENEMYNYGLYVLIPTSDELGKMLRGASISSNGRTFYLNEIRIDKADKFVGLKKMVVEFDDSDTNVISLKSESFDSSGDLVKKMVCHEFKKVNSD